MIDPQTADVRPALFADDQWYPSGTDQLRSLVDESLAEVPFLDLGRPLGLVAPHAGMRFSGGVAAHAYRQLQGQEYDLVVVIAPIHRLPVGPFAVTAYTHYSTPLGRLPVDAGLVQALSDSVPVRRVRRDDEHSLEIQLPFLQRQLGEFPLLPIMMGDQSPEAAQALSSALLPHLPQRRPLIVASSDLSHFHDYDTAIAVDRRLVEAVDAYDPDGLVRLLGRGQAEACGGGPIHATMLLCRGLGADSARVLKYANSGDVWRDRTSVVGYLSAMLYRSI